MEKKQTSISKHREVLMFTLVFVLILAFAIFWYVRFMHPVRSSHQTATMPEGAHRVTVHGMMGCLEPRNPEGVHTMECAFGVTDAAGTSYALHDSDPAYSHVSSAPTGSKVTVTGTFIPDESLQYNSVGSIQVESLTVDQ